MVTPRIERLQHQLQQEIANIIHQELKNPGIGFVTVTAVALSKDMSYAKVFYSCLGPESDRPRSQEALERSAKFIRELVKKRLRLRVIPSFTFIFDTSIEDSIAMTERLERLKKEQRG